MQDLFEPIEEPIPSHRSPTIGSRYAERLILTFLDCGAIKARVRVEDTPYELDELYGLCRRVCRKKDFIREVTVSKNDGQLLIRRLKEVKHEQ